MVQATKTIRNKPVNNQPPPPDANYKVVDIDDIIIQITDLVLLQKNQFECRICLQKQDPWAAKFLHESLAESWFRQDVLVNNELIKLLHTLQSALLIKQPINKMKHS